MSIVAGLRNIGVFDKLAERLLAKVHGIGSNGDPYMPVFLYVDVYNK